jgi:hypothetical protein
MFPLEIIFHFPNKINDLWDTPSMIGFAFKINLFNISLGTPMFLIGGLRGCPQSMMGFAYKFSLFTTGSRCRPIQSNR